MDLRTIVQHLRDNHIHLEGKVTWLRVAKAGSDWMRVIWGAVPSHEATEEAPFIELHYLHTTHNSIWSVGSGLHSVAREHVESSLDLCKYRFPRLQHLPSLHSHCKVLFPVQLSTKQGWVTVSWIYGFHWPKPGTWSYFNRILWWNFLLNNIGSKFMRLRSIWCGVGGWHGTKVLVYSA